MEILPVLLIFLVIGFGMLFYGVYSFKRKKMYRIWLLRAGLFELLLGKNETVYTGKMVKVFSIMFIVVGFLLASISIFSLISLFPIVLN